MFIRGLKFKVGEIIWGLIFLCAQEFPFSLKFWNDS